MALFKLLGRLWKSRRLRIIVTALLIGVICGETKLLLPAEDVLIAARTAIRRQPAPQDIVVVNIDVQTLDALNVDDPPRSLDAQVIEELIESGVNRIFFDRSYQFTEEAKEDQILAATLKKHPGRIYFGATSEIGEPVEMATAIPAPIFRDHVGITSLVGFYHPFKLSTDFPLKSWNGQRYVPSLSAMLAGVENPELRAFRPDYSYDVATMPTLSYVDVLRGNFDRSKLKGKDVVFGLAAVRYNDIHEMPGQGYVPGVYFHVAAAHTLKKGLPLVLGWMPAMLLVSLVIISGIGRGQSLDRYRISGLVTILGMAPLILDNYGIEVEVMPAALAAGVAIFRARALDRVEEASEVNATSGLPTLAAFRSLAKTLPGSVIALKLRNYGAITSSFARPVERQLAEEVVRRIRLGAPDAVIYHEGDMFVWSSTIVDPVALFESIEGLHRIIQTGLVVEDREIDISFNCGVEVNADSALSGRVSGAIQAAEQAARNDEIVCLYEAGRNEVQWEISLLSSLDRAIDNHEVWVAYQPKFDFRLNQIKSAEALVRWTHPQRGPISPEQFVGIAEEYHRIDRLTEYVVNEAVRTAADINRAGREFSVSVNISAQLLRSAGLVPMLDNVLRTHGLRPEQLILEITETDRLDRGSKTFETMQRIVESGMQLSIDDFGTGNATIDYLRYLPASEVKIDKSFVSDIETNDDDLRLVQSIVEMAHSLNRRVVAEGVENKRIMAKLRKLGCDQAQGYHVSRPVRAEDLVAMLQIPSVKKFG